MATFPTYDLADLALFAGEEEDAYVRPDFVPMAVRQATRLFKIATCLTEWPDDAEDAETAEFAVLDMANAIYWVQPFQKVLRNPFSSETIGSYSYSKLTSAVSAGLPTGVSWFDIAISEIGVCELLPTGYPMHGGTLVMEEDKEPVGGYGVFLGPGDQYPDTWAGDTFDPPEPS